MPLSKKDGAKLIADIARGMEQEKWLEHDIDRLEREGKLTSKQADELRKKQERARKNIDKIENEITKTIVARFPSKFGKPRAERKEEEPAKPKEVVVPAEEEEIIKIPKTVLERINSGIETQARYFSSYEEIAKKQLEAFNTIKEVTEEAKAIREDFSEIVYPAGGSTVRIPIGTTILDLWTGDVYLGDGTEGKLSDSLTAVGQLYARSIYIDTNKAFTVQLDGKTPHSISDSGFFSRKGIQCRKVSVEVEETALLKLIASTNPDAEFKETSNIIATGVATPLYTKQLRWLEAWERTIAAETALIVTYEYISTNSRRRVDAVSVSCSKSCIQRFHFTISAGVAGTYSWDRNFDMQGDLHLRDIVAKEGEVMTLKAYNYTNEPLAFAATIEGMEESL